MPTRPSATRDDHARPARWVAVLAAAIAGLLLLGLIASIGGPHDLPGGLASVLYTLVRAGAPAAAYLLGAIGLGRVFRPLLRNAADPGSLQVGLGLGLMLTLSHAMGCLGLLQFAGLPVALAVCIVGLAMLALQIRDRTSDPAFMSRITMPRAVVLGVPAAAVMLVAACSPPGWLWESEARGYDALSYHLQLPQEWLALGRIRPLEHNVYSFLPGYIEAAFYHIGAMTGHEPVPGSPRAGAGLLSGEGMGVLSCQLLHAGIALLGAVLIGRAVPAMIGRDDTRERQLLGAAIAGALFLATPWTVVTGSLAYNDLGVAALTAAALIAAVDRGLPPARRGLLAGLLVGFACGCKPTALFMAGPVVGVLLLGNMPARAWWKAIALGAAAGVATLAPWLIRNAAFSGNPVFPVAWGLFGTGHWTVEQASRYTLGHSFVGSIPDRLGLLLGRDRGLLHPQWFLFVPVALAAAATAAIRSATRRAAMLLVAGMAFQVLAWLSVTHLQSRFLIPLAVPGCVLLGLAVAGGRARWPGPLLAGAACLAQAGATLFIFAAQNGGRPSALLVPGPALRTGDSVPPAQRAAMLGDLGPELFVNFSAPQGALVYLLGDATPLYYTAPVLYNTTWDRWPLGEAMRAAPDRPAEWAGLLRQQGITHVLANLSEIERLRASGWADPSVTADGVRAWLDGHARPVRIWPELGVGLYELGGPPAEGAR